MSDFFDDTPQQESQTSTPESLPGQAKTSASSFFANVSTDIQRKSASETVEESQQPFEGGSFVRVDYLRINRAGTFTKDQDSSDKSRRIEIAEIASPEGIPCKALKVKFKDVSQVEAIDEDIPYFWESKIQLTDNQVSQMQQILNSEWPGKYTVPKTVFAYKNGQALRNMDLPVEVWDNIVNALISRDGRLERFWAAKHVDWTVSKWQKADGKKKPQTFKSEKGFWQHCFLTLYLDGVQPIPNSIPMVELREKQDVLGFRCTDYQSIGFNSFLIALRVVYAAHKGVPVTDVKTLDLAKFVASIPITVTLETQNDANQTCHPKFFTPTKEKFGMSIFEAMGTEEYNFIRSRKEIRLSEDEKKMEWLRACGTFHVGQSSLPAQKQDYKTDARKLL